MEYFEKRKHSFEKIFQYLPQAREIAASKVQLQSARDPESNVLKLAVTSGKKALKSRFLLIRLAFLIRLVCTNRAQISYMLNSYK